jgi:transcriptional regulator with XRE-family HTH domain
VLRGYRESLALSLDDAALVLGCDRSKISRIEAGARGVSSKDLRNLLAEYGIAGEQEAILVLLADPRGAFGWFRDYEEVLPGAWRDYLALETAADGISIYEAQRVPGLLQTPAYARALADMDPFLADERARDLAVEAVTARQRAILGGRRPEVRVVIGEAALRQPAGTEDVMQEQLHSLASVATDSGFITVQVLPFESGAHAAVGDGSVSILRLVGASCLGLVHVGGISGGACLEGSGHLSTYSTIFEHLRAYAHTPARSAALLRELAER